MIKGVPDRSSFYHFAFIICLFHTSLRANASIPRTEDATDIAIPPKIQSVKDAKLYAPCRTCGSRDRIFSGVGYVSGRSVISTPDPYRTIHRTVIPTTVLLLTDPTATPIATTAASMAEMVATAARHPANVRSSVRRKWNSPSMTRAMAANVDTTTSVRACHLATKYWYRLIPRLRTESASVPRSDEMLLTHRTTISARLPNDTARSRSLVWTAAGCASPASRWTPTR